MRGIELVEARESAGLCRVEEVKACEQEGRCVCWWC